MVGCREDFKICTKQDIPCLPDGWEYRRGYGGRGDRLMVDDVCVVDSPPCYGANSSDKPRLSEVEEGTEEAEFVMQVWDECRAFLASERAAARKVSDAERRATEEERQKTVSVAIRKAMCFAP